MMVCSLGGGVRSRMYCWWCKVCKVVMVISLNGSDSDVWSGSKRMWCVAQMVVTVVFSLGGSDDGMRSSC